MFLFRWFQPNLLMTLLFLEMARPPRCLSQTCAFPDVSCRAGRLDVTVSCFRVWVSFFFIFSFSPPRVAQAGKVAKGRQGVGGPTCQEGQAEGALGIGRSCNVWVATHRLRCSRSIDSSVWGRRYAVRRRGACLARPPRLFSLAFSLRFRAVAVSHGYRDFVWRLCACGDILYVTMELVR